MCLSVGVARFAFIHHAVDLCCSGVHSIVFTSSMIAVLNHKSLSADENDIDVSRDVLPVLTETRPRCIKPSQDRDYTSHYT